MRSRPIEECGAWHGQACHATSVPAAPANMVIVSLCGGLGNQLFQYAAAQSVAFRHSASLLLDVSWFEGKQLGIAPGIARRRFELGQLRISGVRASDRAARAAARRVWVVSLLRRARLEILGRLLPGPRVFLERSLSFDQNWTKIIPPVQLAGYFQSERYFSSISAVLRHELQAVDSDIEARKDRIIAKARSDCAHLVGVHVRRGDYLNSDIARFHRTPGSGYLREAMATFGRGAGFLIVSDDPSWCRETLGAPRVHISNGGDPLVDLYAFAACDSFILSASSFSWWGAWLGDSDRTKRVVAPREWGGPARKGGSYDDVFRKHWELR